MLSKIIELAHEISTKTKADMFADYSGHVNELTVYYHKNGWESKKDFDYYKQIYLDGRSGTANLNEIYDKLISLAVEYGIKENTP